MYHWNNIHGAQGDTERRVHYIGKDRFAFISCTADRSAARRRSGVANYRGNYAPRSGRKGRAKERERERERERDKVVFEATKT